MPPPFGLLNLDKPAGVTSRDVVDTVQRLVRPAKAGHAGTLDPLATGVLVICVGPATRLIPFVQAGRKVYRATFRFRVTSETDDIEGTLVEVPQAPRLTLSDIVAVLPEFIGTIEQVPPTHSAVHVAGKRAYELARQGAPVALAAKPVEVFRFDPLRFDEDAQELECEIECGSGTYVRSLGRDLAKRLGNGAVMTALRRTAVGPFLVEEAVSPDELTRETLPELLRPPGSALQDRPRVACDDNQAAAIRRGRSIPLPAGVRLADGDSVGLFDAAGRLVAVGMFDARDATLKPRIVFPAE
jgi:tRNA pseudouridine55 synthase